MAPRFLACHWGSEVELGGFLEPQDGGYRGLRVTGNHQGQGNVGVVLINPKP
jgi:hypothetical protein